MKMKGGVKLSFCTVNEDVTGKIRAYRTDCNSNNNRPSNNTISFMSTIVGTSG
jgi:hypothetical protein